MKLLSKTLAVSLVTLMGTGFASACTCPPYADAADHASRFDFVAVGHVEDVWQLPVEDGSVAMLEYARQFTNALADYVEAVEAGEETRNLEAFRDDYYAENPPPARPPYPQGGGAISRISVSDVLKGEDTSQIYLHTSRPGNPTCGLSYEEDSDVIILANDNDGRLGAWMCSIPMFSREEYEAALSSE